MTSRAKPGPEPSSSQGPSAGRAACPGCARTSARYSVRIASLLRPHLAVLLEAGEGAFLRLGVHAAPQT